jgi:hypothetical protein
MLVIALLVIPPESMAAPEDTVWVWFTSCGGPTLTVEILIDKKVVHKTSVSICHTDSDTLRARNESRSIEVRLTPTRDITWSGYRDLPEVAPAGRPLTLSLWQVEAGVTDLSIGVSAMDKDKQNIYMNKVHVAHPDRRDETEIAAGVVVATFPHGGSAKPAKP